MDNVVLINPIEQIGEIFEFNGYKLKDKWVLSHIKFDPNLDNDYDYQIIRQSSHDGTLLFTSQLIGRALKPLVKMETYCKKDLTEEELNSVESIEYTIGNIKLESEYGMIETIIGEMIPGVTNTVSIPVRCKYKFK